jgi:heavy metal sensor kinase
MSLNTRLSAFFLLTLALVLAGFSVSLYFLARTHLHRQAEERLRAALETLTAAAELETGGLEWEPQQHHLTLGQDAAEDQVRWTVHDPEEDRPVDRSPNLGDRDLSAPPAGGRPARTHGPDGARWYMASRRLEAEAGVKLEPGRHRALVLTVGVSLAPLGQTLRTLATALAGLSVGVWLAAALAGRFLARRALSPLTRMAAAARGMGAADLDERLPEPGTGDELDDLRRAFNGLLDRLGEAFERQRRFTGDASHQLRTPLTAMLGQIEVALRRDRPVEDYRRTLELAHGQASHLRKIVESLLFLTRADLDAEPGLLEQTDLATWLPAQLARWSEHVRAADLRTECSCGDSLAVRVQPVLLGQLLDNLLENAFKYSEAGSPVTVTLARDGDAAVLSVRDAGRGIAADDLPHVFEPFYRSADARRLGRPGVGLGLAVVGRIAAAFGGEVRAESVPAGGSLFTLRLQAVRHEPSEPAPADARPETAA